MAAARKRTNNHGVAAEVHAPEPQDPVRLAKKLAAAPPGALREPQVSQDPRHGEQGHVVYAVQVEKGLQPLHRLNHRATPPSFLPPPPTTTQTSYITHNRCPHNRGMLPLLLGSFPT